MTTSEGGASAPGPQELAATRADPSRRKGHYLVLGELGRGGMGVVYRAWDERLRRLVALKVLLSGETDPESQARFHREGEAVARLQHPNIIAVHELGAIENRPYIAMQFVEGRTLADRIGKAGQKKLPLNKALEAMRDVARALEYAHAQGVLHRDLKPQNIIIDALDRPHLLDFGLAQLRDSGTKLTATGATLGTPAYMPPEQTGGERTDERSDVYSLGATLYHVLTGRPPFEGATPLNIMAAVLRQPPSPPSRLNPRAAGDLDTITLRCLEKDPARRYPSAAELASDLDRHLTGDPIRARPLGSVERSWRWARRNKAGEALVLLAGLLLASLGLGGVLVVRARETVRREEIETARTRSMDALAAFRARCAGSTQESGATNRQLFDLRLGLGLTALQACGRVLDLAPGDEDARKRMLEATSELGELAIRAEQWSVATSVFEQAADPQRAREGVVHVEAERARSRKAHGDEVRKILEEARTGKIAEEMEGYQEGLFTLVRLSEEQTVTLLAGALGELTSKIQGGESLDAVSVRFLKFVCEALGRIGIREGAVPALGAYLDAESTHEEVRAVEAGIALCRLGGPEASRRVLAARERFGWESQFWHQLKPFTHLLEVGTEQPTTPDGFVVRAGTRRATGDLEGAIADCTKALELDPGYREALGNRGAVRRESGDLDGAIADYQKALALDPRYPALWNLLGNAHHGKGDLDRAVADYTKALELDPGLALTWNYRGIVRSNKGDLAGALSDFTRAVELDAHLAAAWHGRGQTRLRIGDLDGTIDDCTKAIELEPRLAPAWNDRAEARRQTGDLDGAMADTTKALELDPRLAVAWLNRGEMRRVKQDLEGALKDFTKAVELDPRSTVAWARRGFARWSTRDREGAIADYTKALELDPRCIDAWVDRGIARQDKGDLDGAIADYTKALELDPGKSLIWGNRAHAREKKGDRDGAIADFERFLELDPGSPRAPTVRALIARLRGSKTP